MRKPLLLTLVVCLCALVIASGSEARKVDNGVLNQERYQKSTQVLNNSLSPRPLNSATVQGTTVLGRWTFDSGGVCDPDGWISTDLTAQLGDYWHVDDFSGLGGGDFGLLQAIEGTKSMWLGTRNNAASQVLCGYATLPGYGNSWDQAFCSRCFTVSGGVDVTYLVSWDSEPGYDATVLEYDLCDDNWQAIGPTYDATVQDSLAVVALADSNHAGEVRFRFHFTSDGAWSDQDGLWDTDGAVILDSLSVNDGTGQLSFEDFEAEAIGANATVSGDWESCNPVGYGDFAGLYPGIQLLQEDPCFSEFSCVWGFFNGSTSNYACGGFPGVATVPFENTRGQYIANEVWSPVMPFTGSGTSVKFRFRVYRDLPLDNLVFYIWRVRAIDGTGCPGPWRRDNTSYFGDDKDWLQDDFEMGQLIDAGAASIQVGVGVVDRCAIWCGQFGTGQCHSHTPLLDNFEVIRVAQNGPSYEQQGWDVFQDNFASDGTTTGTVRIDTANDILPGANPNILPGDSAAVRVADPQFGLAADPYTGFGSAVYMYLSVRPSGQPGKSGDALTDDPFRWPVVDSTTSPDGEKWYCVRMDTAFVQGGRTAPAANEYCVDLNDNLFTPGDTIFYFWCAESGDGSRSYFHGGLNVLDNFDAAGAVVTTTDIGVAYNNALEVTCLPANGINGGPAADILYVDDGDGRGVQPFFDTAFDQLGLTGKVDRYDVEAPSSNVANGPGSRVQDIFQQIIPIYKKIIWNSEELTNGTIADGTVDKSPDFDLLFTFLDQSDNNPGLYISGDGIASEWAALTSPGALNVKGLYMNFGLVSSDHTSLNIGTSPYVIGTSGSCFDHILGPDTLIAYGGCPVINTFDVLSTGGGASNVEAAYNGNLAQGAILSQITPNNGGSEARVMLAGFSYDLIRDDRPGANGGVADRVHHLFDIITWLLNTPDTPVGVTPESFRNSLAQNYPNPFNPTTTISFTLKDRAPVSLKVYNVAGQLVRTLVTGAREPGVTHSVSWDGRNDAGQSVSSGVYFYRLVTTNFTQTKKMVLLK